MPARRPRPGARFRGRSRPRPAGRPGGRTYPLKWVAAALAVTAAVLIGGPYLFIYLFLGSSPGKLTLPPAAGVAAGPVAAGPVSGTWRIGPGSIAGYRVDELLFGQTHTAVGRTSRVTGGMVISGTEVTAADFSVDVASIKSDQGSRDVQFRGFIMDAADYPHATFRLTSPIQLGTVPKVGQTVTHTATGDLTLRGTTRSVTFTLNAERLARGIDVQAEIPVRFGLWHIPNPSFAVARLGPVGTVEILLQMIPVSGPAAGTPGP